MENNLYEYAFTTFPGFSRPTKQRLLETFSEEEILTFSDKEFRMLLSPKEWKLYEKYKMQQSSKILHNKSKINSNTIFNIEETQKEWKDLQEKGIDFIYYKEHTYPEKLRNIPDPPLGLFYKGKWTNAPSIAIVGSRIPTAYGTEMAKYFARELTKAGVSIISGLAHGIDVAAHKGALEAGRLYDDDQGVVKEERSSRKIASTIAVLGCGVDIPYPKENYPIYEQILNQEGAILSEYKPGTIPMAYRFPERNRIISGLSDGVLVVEAKTKSGSLITADAALEQGRDVFALPGRVTDPLSSGSNWLLREGARIVTEPGHILEELSLLYENKEKNLAPGDNLLDSREKIVYACLSLDPKSVESIINETNYPVSEVISILFRLELNGYVKQMVRGYYTICL